MCFDQVLGFLSLCSFLKAGAHESTSSFSSSTLADLVKSLAGSSAVRSFSCLFGLLFPNELLSMFAVLVALVWLCFVQAPSQFTDFVAPQHQSPSLAVVFVYPEVCSLLFFWILLKMH